MAPGAIVFLTPLAGLVALAAVVPLAALAFAAVRMRRARVLLGLPAPPPARLLPNVAALAAVPLLLGLAATQPVLQRAETARVRTDAEAMFVIDISRSMLAAKGPSGLTRLTRARRAAIAIRAALPEVPSGVATFTDRVLPALLPSPSRSVFDATVRKVIEIDEPPPGEVNVTATTLDALGVLGTGNFFPASARKRLVVVLTDGESRPYDARKVARELASGPGIKLVLVHVWSQGEAVYDGSQLEQGYHEDPESAEALAGLAAAAHGSAVTEQQLGTAIAKARADLGTGPTTSVARVEQTRPLAPLVALAALIVLVGLATVRERHGIRALARKLTHARSRRRIPAAPRRGVEGARRPGEKVAAPARDP